MLPKGVQGAVFAGSVIRFTLQDDLGLSVPINDSPVLYTCASSDRTFDSSVEGLRPANMALQAGLCLS